MSYLYPGRAKPNGGISDEATWNFNHSWEHLENEVRWWIRRGKKKGPSCDLNIIITFRFVALSLKKEAYKEKCIASAGDGGLNARLPYHRNWVRLAALD